MPVLVSLTVYARELESRPDLSLAIWLREHLENKGGVALVAAFEQCFAKGTCWMFFDGVDEVGRPDLRAAIVRNLESWRRKSVFGYFAALWQRIVGWRTDAAASGPTFT